MVLSDFLINTDFNCIQAQFSSVELRGVTLEREDGWLATNFDELYIRIFIMLEKICQKHPSFFPGEELVGLLTAASYKGLFPGSGQPTAPSCFLRHQPHSPASAASGFSTFCQQSKARKQCVQAVYRRPGPGSLWGNHRLVLRSRWKNGADGMQVDQLGSCLSANL